jgi:hypothetical protein
MVFGNQLQHSTSAVVASHSCTATTAWAFEKVWAPRIHFHASTQHSFLKKVSA